MEVLCSRESEGREVWFSFSSPLIYKIYSERYDMREERGEEKMKKKMGKAQVAGYMPVLGRQGKLHV